jgi:hypothetical protein
MTGSILDRYLRKPDAGDEPTPSTLDPASDPDAAETIGCFGWHRGTRDFPKMLELRKKDGSITAVGYAWIERVDYDPDRGITIHALGQTLRITGHNLNAETRPAVRLYQGIVRHRVGWVEEGTRDAEAVNGETTIASIEV